MFNVGNASRSILVHVVFITDYPQDVKPLIRHRQAKKECITAMMHTKPKGSFDRENFLDKECRLMGCHSPSRRK